ncbi:hypothetical protein [Chthoniobacter flavus]|uniref:hypothetical protein n=1 Tax=Chthoniobacter flavus TaxID=191863 RepID=UPI0005B25595|nr:hypothetical protein [Chthoniobacter flavus]
MNASIHEAMYGRAPNIRPRPIVALTTLIFVPVAFGTCTLIVHRASQEDFLGFDIVRAFWASNGIASAVVLALSIWSLRRHERHVWLGYLLMLVACGWLPLIIFLGRWISF